MTSFGIVVLFAGEIIPQALCKSYALLIGNYCAGMVRVLCYAVGIISWPVSKVLDYVLGNEHTVSCLLLLHVLLAAPCTLLHLAAMLSSRPALLMLPCLPAPALPCSVFTQVYCVSSAYLACYSMPGHLHSQ